MSEKIKLPKFYPMNHKSTMWGAACFKDVDDISPWKKLCEGGKPIVLYCIVGYELCPSTQRPHLQWYIRFENKITKSSVMKHLPGMHVAPYDGGDFKNKKYSSEDGNVKYEYGTPSKQGERTDLNLIRDQIASGVTVDSLAMENPYLFHQYGRTLSKVEDICMRKKYRKEMTQGFWYFGPTDVGKSHTAYEGFTPETHYVLNINDNGWWDGYAQQETVIINEFRGQIPYSELLDLVDKWPKTVKRRCREPMPFLSKKLIITSSLAPEVVYKNLHKKDSLEQLSRRFEIYEIKQRGKTEKYSIGNNETIEEDESAENLISLLPEA